METIHNAVAWYQKKIGSYDKQLWEQSVEQKVLVKGLRYAPRKSGRVKTELIDVDLVKGSTFTKAKPQLEWIMITKMTFVRVIFFPLYYKWWIQQTCRAFCVAMLVLYTLHAGSLGLFVYHRSRFISKPNISVINLVVPCIMMAVLGLVHSQTVLSHVTHKPPVKDSKVKRRLKSRIKKSADLGTANGIQSNGCVKRMNPLDDVPESTAANAFTNSNFVELDHGISEGSVNGSQTPGSEKESDIQSGEDIEPERFVYSPKARLNELKCSCMKSADWKTHIVTADNMMRSEAMVVTLSDTSQSVRDLSPNVSDVGDPKMNDGSNLLLNRDDGIYDAVQGAVGFGSGFGSGFADKNEIFSSSLNEADGRVTCGDSVEDNKTEDLASGSKIIRDGFDTFSLENVALDDWHNNSITDCPLKLPMKLDGSIVNIQEVYEFADEMSAAYVENSSDYFDIQKSSLNGNLAHFNDLSVEENGESTGCILRHRANISGEKGRPARTDPNDQIQKENRLFVDYDAPQDTRREIEIQTLTSLNLTDMVTDNSTPKHRHTLGGNVSSQDSAKTGDLFCPIKPDVDISPRCPPHPTARKSSLKKPCVDTACRETPPSSNDSGTKTKTKRPSFSLTNVRRRRGSNSVVDMPHDSASFTYGSNGRARRLNKHTVRIQDLIHGAVSSSEGESGSPHIGFIKHAGLSSEECEDRMQSDVANTSSTTSSMGSANELSEPDDPMTQDDPTTWSASMTHVMSLLQPSSSTSHAMMGQPDRVSCMIWEGNECKKVDLTALDIGWAIIEKVDKIPESSDYIMIGTCFSVLMSFVPLLYKMYLSTSLDTFDINKYLDVIATAFSFSSDEWMFTVININGMIQRFCLGLAFFFLLSVADRTFKQRLLYAKHFCYLTSSRRSRKYDMPHFRLNKVCNIKAWLSLRSYLKKRGPQRSVDVIVSSAFIMSVVILALMGIQLLKDSDKFLENVVNWDLFVWCLALSLYILRYMTLGLKINKKYRNLSVLITEQINLYLQMEQKPHKKEDLMIANNVLKLAEDLIKELESPFKISGMSANPLVYNIMKVILLSAFSAVLSELLGFKLKLYKIKMPGVGT